VAGNKRIGSLVNAHASIVSNANADSKNSSKVHKGLKKKKAMPDVSIPLVFTLPDPIIVEVPFSGGVISEAGTRSNFLSSPSQDVIAGVSAHFNYNDRDILEFLKTNEGKIFLHTQNTRRPVHILADFDYATLNKVLNPREPDHSDSGAARMWSRNANARAWRDWVSSCLILEMGLGPESGSDEGFRIRTIAEDQMTVRMDGQFVPWTGVIGSTHGLFGNKATKHILHNLIDGYTMVYYLEDFINQVFSMNPYIEPNMARGYNLMMWMMHYFDLTSLGSVNTTMVNTIKKIAKRFHQVIDPDHDGQNRLRHGFSYLPTTRRDPLLFRLHHPNDQQGFIKSVIESTRLIAHYLNTSEFCYRNADSNASLEGENNPEWIEDQDFNRYFGEIRTWNTLHSTGVRGIDYDISGDIYRKSFRVRKRLLDSVYLSKQTNNRVYIKGISSINKSQSSVIDVEGDFGSQDDIEKLLARVHRLDSENIITIAPYLLGDYVSRTDDGEINHFLTMSDIFTLKKKTTLDLFKAKRKKKETEYNQLVKSLERFTFNHGPQQLRGLMGTLRKQFCPITKNSSIDEKRGLLLIDQRNIVAHLTRGKAAQAIMSAALEKVYRTATNSGHSEPFYKMKILNKKVTSEPNTRQRAAWDIYDNAVDESQAGIMISNVNTDRSTNIISRRNERNETAVVSGFLDEKKEISDDLIHLLNAAFTKSLDSPSKREFMFWCILLQLSDVSLVDENKTPFFMQQRVVASEEMQKKKLPGIADVLFNEYINRLNDHSFFMAAPGNKVSNFFERAKEDRPVAFSVAPLSSKVIVTNYLIKKIKSKTLDTRAGGPIKNAFDDIASLQDKINRLPNMMDNAYENYRSVIFDLLDRVSRTVPADGNEYAQSAAEFFANQPPGRSDSWSAVIQDFVHPGGAHQATLEDGAGAFTNRGATALQTSIRLDGDRNTYYWDTLINGQITGIRGRTAGGARGASGFASAKIRDGERLHENFKNSALEGIADHILNFDRNTNILIMLSENICAQLFFGFPAEDSGLMFDQQYLSSFERNEEGILRYLNLIDDSGTIRMTQAELFDVVWEYCVIADQLTQQLPTVNLEFQFDRSTFRDHIGMAPEIDEEYHDFDSVYSLQRSTSEYNALLRSSQQARNRLNTYLPPAMFEGRDATSSAAGSKSGSHEVARQQITFGGTTEAEALQRKQTLVNDVFDLAARAAIFFHYAEKEIAKEPEFSLILKKENNDSTNVYTQLSANLRLGFLDHITIDSDFSRHAMKFMKDANPNSHTRNDPRRAPYLLAPATIDKYVGLKTSQFKFDLTDNLMGRIGDENFNFSVISAENEPDENLVPFSSRARVVYHPDYKVDEVAIHESQWGIDEVELFTSLEINPRSCFGFVYNLGVNQANNTAVDSQHFNSNFAINNAGILENEQRRGDNLLNRFEGQGARFSNQANPIAADATMTSGFGFDYLNEYYSKRLGLTPPAIYTKLLQKIKDLPNAIEEIKGTTSVTEYNRVVHQTHVNTAEFKIRQLEEPVEKTRTKIVVEFAVKKQTYQFVKAFQVEPNVPLRVGEPWDGQIYGSITAVRPYNAQYGSWRSPRQLFAQLADTAATFLDAGDVLTFNEMYTYPEETRLGIVIRQGAPASVDLNSLGNYVRGRTYGPIPVEGHPYEDIYGKHNFYWHMKMLCATLGNSSVFGTDSSHDPWITDDHTNSTTRASTTLQHTQIVDNGLRPGVEYDTLVARARRYSAVDGEVTLGSTLWKFMTNGTHAKKYLGRASSINPEGYDGNFWQDYWRWVSTAPTPLILRATTRTYPDDVHPVAYYPSETPTEAAQTIFSTRLHGEPYFFKDNVKNKWSSLWEGSQNFHFHYPEFHTTNKILGTIGQAADPKIRVEFYLAKNGNGEWSHFSTTPIYNDETNHPTARPISRLREGGHDAYQAICLRPDIVAKLFYRFVGGFDPRYYGPYVPGQGLVGDQLIDGYNVNDTLPFIEMVPWGSYLQDALTRNNLNVGRQDFISKDNPYEREITTEEMLGITTRDLDQHFRAKSEKVTEATRPYAIQYLDSVRWAIETYISENVELSADKQKWLRKVIGYMPYFYEWSIEYPSLDLKIYVESEKIVIPPDVYIDFNWDLLKARTNSFAGQRAYGSATRSYEAQYRDETISRVYKLEKEYLQFLYSMYDYADLTSSTFTAGMTLYEDVVNRFSAVPNEADGNHKNAIIRSDNKYILDEIGKFVEGNGIVDVTPDVIANLDSIYRLYLEQYESSYASDPERHKARGLKILPLVSTHTPFKISPYDIRTPTQLRNRNSNSDNDSIANELTKWKYYEDNLVIPRGGPAFEDAKTRVCFIGIEAGELHKILHSPSQNYGGKNRTEGTFRQAIYDPNNNTERNLALSNKTEKFQVKLELFDFFRPWLRFKNTNKIIVSRAKPYRVLRPLEFSVGSTGSRAGNLHEDHLCSPIIDNLLKEQYWREPVAEELTVTSNQGKKLSGGSTHLRGYDIIDIFLKAYASNVLGLDFFSFMIPSLGTTPPIADYQPDLSNQGQLPEERNYQEYLNEYAGKLITLIQNADAGSDFTSINHLLKYFLDRKNLRAQTGQDMIRHFDNVGRVTLIPGDALSFGLLEKNAVDTSDPEHPKLYPFRFSKPITKKSLVASEILTAVNEYTINPMKEFRDGFAFDRVVGIPYKLSDFKLTDTCRDNLNGEEIDISQLKGSAKNRKVYNDGDAGWKLTEEYYNELLKSLTYLDKDKNDGTVLDNSLYPLTLRATICRIEED
tara:strand:+ start:4644 stop:12902 length:8259 start_codon:yes stop_codon:yes gene_type:complete